MDILEFLVVSFCNVAVCYWIIRRHGVASVEGYCAAALGMAALTDNVGLLVEYVRQSGPVGAAEFSFRVYPTVVHIVALMVLMTGLFLANPRPRPVGREFSPEELDFVAGTGVALLVLGLILTGFTVGLTGAYHSANFLGSLDKFRGDDPGATGGFFYKGADIAVLGLALTLPRVRTKAAFTLALLGMLVVSFCFRANKGGFELPILWTAVALHTYNRRRFISLARPGMLVACLGLAVVGFTAKGVLLIRSGGPRTLDSLTTQTVGMIGTRLGDDGVYRGWCQFINVWPHYRYLFRGHAEAVDSLTNWIPRALQPQHVKMQPTTGLGFMVHSDYHVYPKESPSVGLVGTVYADDGFYSLILYLLITGLLLGILRRHVTDRCTPIHWQVSYFAFALFQGLSAESGINATIYTFLLTFSATGLAHVAVIGHFKYIQRRAMLTHPVEPPSCSVIRDQDLSSNLVPHQL